MKTTIYGQDQRVIAFVSKKLEEYNFQETASGIGVESDGELIAGVVFDGYTEAGMNIHVAALEGRHWLSREFLYSVFAYPFIQLKCNRVTGLVRADNFKAQKLDEHLGFVKEGLIRRGCSDGTNMILYGMLKEECRWIHQKEQVYGK